MSSNPWTLSSHLSRAADPAHPVTDYRARIFREQHEAAERSQRERAEQSSDLNNPEVRIRAWERLHRLTLPREPTHSVLSVIAKATHLTLEQVREEQRRRSAPSPRPQLLDPRGEHDAGGEKATSSPEPAGEP
jgi:hypothetical protein